MAWSFICIREPRFQQPKRAEKGTHLSACWFCKATLLTGIQSRQPTLSHGVVPRLSIFINSSLSDDVDHDLSGRPGQSDGPMRAQTLSSRIVWILTCPMVCTQPARGDHGAEGSSVSLLWPPNYSLLGLCTCAHSPSCICRSAHITQHTFNEYLPRVQSQALDK